MPTVSITSPANDGDDFPATIAGTYSDQTLAAVPAGAGGPPPPPPIPALLSVSLTNQSSAQTTVYGATAANGLWSLAKPGGLATGVKYTITATYSTASDTKTDIQN